MFAYYNILRFYCFKKSLQVTSVKFFFKDVQISKYWFFMISNPDFLLFFQSLFAPSSVGNTISGSCFSQNLKIPYWKSLFLIHRQILRPTLSWKDLWNSLLLYLVVEILQLVHEIAVFRRSSIKEEFWNTQHSQINTRSSHPEVFCKKKRCPWKFCKIHRKTFLS